MTAAERLAALARDLDDVRRVEFLTVLQEAGVGPYDLELAKLLKVLLIYKAYYETIPADLRTVQQEHSDQLKTFHTSMKALTETITQRLEAVAKAVGALDAQAVANRVNLRLDQEVLAAFQTGLASLVRAGDQAEAAAARAQAGIHQWQRASLAGIWLSAFIVSLTLSAAAFAAAWFYLR